MNTPDKTGALASLWLEFKQDKDFADFIKYNDIGLPMAYYVAEGLVTELTPLGEQYILETFELFLSLINVTEEEIDDLLEDKTLAAILMLGYNKKNAKPE
jgi:predicted RNA-binding protein associated with RNAse of E/G family